MYERIPGLLRFVSAFVIREEGHEILRNRKQTFLA